MTSETVKEIQREFSRQAQPMASAPAFREQAALQRLIRAVGDAPSHRVLDLGCGPGIVAGAIAPRIGQVIGIDATHEMVRLARQHVETGQLTNGSFSVASAERVPFDRGRFDEVLTRLTIHHFADVPAVLSEARRVLRPAGRLIVADVISSADPEESRLHNALERLRDPTHVRMLRAEELLETIQRSGFSVLHVEEWTQSRSFPEWVAIINKDARTEPLQHIMRALAQAGQTAGISLREEGGELRFTHTWMLVEAAPA